MGYIIIQLILEEIFNKPFDRIAEELIFNPLGMNDSTFKYPLPSAREKREASLHNNQGVPTHPGIIPSAQAHGGLLTTPYDLSLFGVALMQAYQGQSSGIITPALVHNMFEQRVWVEDTSDLGFQFGMGFGCFMVMEGETKMVFHPGGNDPGASSLICLVPEKGLGAVIMTNGMRGLPLSTEILKAISSEYDWL
jgi:CubicO group peptidase (beta-lactamase class C family)